MSQIINANRYLSIIMPCYKGESFIEESIETVEKEISLFEKNFELIVVICRAPACFWSNIPLGYLNFVLSIKC